MPGEAGDASDLGQLWAAVDAFFPSIYLSSQVRLCCSHRRSCVHGEHAMMWRRADDGGGWEVACGVIDGRGAQGR